MKRKTFLRLSSMIAAAPLLDPVKGLARPPKLKNWAGNIEYSTANVVYPSTVQEVQSIIQKTTDLRLLGTRHCFNRIADSKHELISTKNLNKILSLDTSAKTVTVEAGIKYGELAPYLHEKGFALHNLASLPHISVGGACSTGTHGSGVNNSNLSSQVKELEMVIADGTVINFSREKDKEHFGGTVVSLGALGAITKITLDLQPTFMMRQNVFEKMPLTELQNHFEEVVSAGYSVSLFTDWQSESINEVWIKRVDDEGTNYQEMQEFFGAKAATRNLHPISSLSAENCTGQMGVPGPWYERLPHFKMGFMPSSGKELQTEYFIPFEHGMEGIIAIQKIGQQIGPHLLISEIRTINADNLWISPCYRQKSVAIHFTWKQDWESVSRLLPVIENALAPYNVKPHWGKLFTLSPKVLTSRHTKFEDFKKLALQYDPKGKFHNDFLKPLFSAVS
jgi:xylitol oxidase